MITIIAAVAKNRAIMGRNTFLSLPKGALPNRRNIVLSRSAFTSPPKLGGVRGGLRSAEGRLLPEGRKNNSQCSSLYPGCDVFPSLEEALAHCTPDEDIYIIGGASVYRQALPLADRLCLTEIDDTPAEADTFFPPYEDDWKEEQREDHDVDEKHAHRYAFVDYIRK